MDRSDLYELLVEHVGDAVFMVDLAGRIATWTPAAARIFGHTSGEIVGQPIDALYTPDDRARETPAAHLALALANGRFETQGLQARRDGSTFWASVVVCPMRARDGELTGSGVIVHDLTDAHAADEVRRLYAMTLESSNRELHEFASVASHDLQEPLRKIVAFSGRLKVTAGERLDPQSQEHLARIESAAMRMKSLISDLLSYSRLAGMRESVRRVELAKIAADAVSDLSDQIERTGGAVELDALPAIDAEPSALRQLFQNLVGNALKFHAKGASPRVRISSRALTNERIELTFADNGIGFDEKYASRIFGMLQRLHGRDEYEGTGMGLAICRRIVERHGGEIVAHGRAGAGATFVVTLPVSQKKAA